VQPPYPKMLLDTAKGFNPATAFLDADGVSATLSFLNTYAEVKEISTPRTVTLDNGKGHLSRSASLVPHRQCLRGHGEHDRRFANNVLQPHGSARM